MRLLAISTMALALSVAAVAGPVGHGSGHGKAAKAPKAAKGKKVVKVKGYNKEDGTHIAGHDRTGPDQTQTDNWSAQGNADPETGKPGTKTIDH